MAFIEISELSKTYSLGETTTPALNGVDLEINKGELVILYGPSGAGKTTLLNMIGGLDIPTSGTVTVDEIPVSTLSAKWLTAYRKKKIGVVFQFFNLISRLNALENIEYAIDLIGVRQGEGKPSFKSKIIRQKAKEYLEKVGLKDRMHHFPAQLSGGEQQRVSIARALAKEPEILLADEPTGNLDYKIGRNVLEIMEAMTGKAQNRTVIIVTHNPAICPLGDRVVRLSDGKVAENYTQKYTPAKELYW
ncbi:macrolide ABC transporter ATP-binding protein [Candidatus Heimdallarchaeota archaeon B3_Heim]|nr:MAG: macrolide ABC transporter ATP-binding protein [Candidatus Heimdallarchaeota archaeon B3_Heim]